MESVWWILIVLSFVIGMIGIVYPVVPGVLMIWLGFVMYVWALNGVLSMWFWIGMAVLTVFILLADVISNIFFVNKNGGTRRTQWIAVAGILIGSFVLPPFGIIIVPFLLVLLVEMLRLQDGAAALRVALATVIAFISSSLAKFFIQGVMIGWFVVEVIRY